MKLSATKNASQDFRLQTALIDWTDISITRACNCCPIARGKQMLRQTAWVATASSRKMAAFRS